MKGISKSNLNFFNALAVTMPLSVLLNMDIHPYVSNCIQAIAREFSHL